MLSGLQQMDGVAFFIWVRRVKIRITFACRQIALERSSNIIEAFEQREFRFRPLEIWLREPNFYFFLISKIKPRVHGRLNLKAHTPQRSTTLLSAFTHSSSLFLLRCSPVSVWLGWAGPWGPSGPSDPSGPAGTPRAGTQPQDLLPSPGEAAGLTSPAPCSANSGCKEHTNGRGSTEEL